MALDDKQEKHFFYRREIGNIIWSSWNIENEEEADMWGQ